MTVSYRASAAPATALLILATLCGCASEPPDPVSISFWQRSLEQYVWDRGNGDPNVLRDMSWDNIHKGFAVISDSLPRRSVDAIGLLVAHRRVEDKLYFLFMLGMVNQDRLEDLRPIALNVEQGTFHWVVGDENRSAIEMYRQWLGPNRFPAPDDEFHLVVTGTHVTVVHRESGARWEFAIPRDTGFQPVQTKPVR